MRPNARGVLFKLWSRLEHTFARAQGKGYGTDSIRREVRLLRSFLAAEPELAVDVGGNVGNYTAELRRRNPALEIHTFEPSATNVKRLAERFQGDRLVTLVPRAVSDRHGAAVLYSNEPGSGLGSLTQRRLDHLGIPFDTTEPIQTIRFEEYWRDSLHCRDLDLVKIDIEGHELSALRGFGSAIDAVKVLQFEFGGCNIDTRTFFRDFWYFFKEHGFDLYRITPFGAEPIPEYRERDEYFSTTNYIAVKSRPKGDGNDGARGRRSE